MDGSMADVEFPWTIEDFVVYYEAYYDTATQDTVRKWSRWYFVTYTETKILPFFILRAAI